MNLESFRKQYQKKEVIEYPHRVPSQPLVSVLIQTFQHQNFIQECLEGVLQQITDFPIEILIGEDSSTDGTREICRQIASENPEKIRLFLHHPANKIKVLNSVTGNFNATYNLLSAKGRFIAFCEGDDVWVDPQKLQKQVEHLRSNPDLVLTYHSFLEVDEHKKPIPKNSILDQPALDITSIELIRLKHHPLLSTSCFRNIFSSSIPQEMPEVINMDSFLISVLGNFGSAGYTPSLQSSLYRRHSGGIWSDKGSYYKLRSKQLTYWKLVKYYCKSADFATAGHFIWKLNQIKRIQLLDRLKKMFSRLSSDHLK